MPLFVVRHAEAAGDEDADPGLSSDGVGQAGALARRLERLHPSMVLFGPRRRAEQTAHIVAGALGIPAEEMADLDDRTPVPSSERRCEYPEHRWPWLDAVPADQRDVDGHRLTAAWQRHSSQIDSSTAVLVTHAFVVAWFVTLALDAPTATWMRLPAAHTGLTTFRRTSDSSELVVDGFNDTGHLAPNGLSTPTASPPA